MDVVGEAPIRSRMWAMQNGVTGSVRRYRRVGAKVVTTTYRLGADDDLGALLAAIGTDGDTSPWAISVEPTAPTLLVCTQGSHDVCCGSEGIRFAAEVEAAFPDLDVVRVSHTGGHRFAPTGMTFPDGRMWAWMDLELVSNLIEGTGSRADVARRCRGWWGAGRGVGQIAERTVFAEAGSSLDQSERTVSMSADGVVDVSTSTDTWSVRVTERRTVPTITCRADAGEPLTWATEYDAEVVRHIHR